MPDKEAKLGRSKYEVELCSACNQRSDADRGPCHICNPVNDPVSKICCIYLKTGTKKFCKTSYIDVGHTLNSSCVWMTPTTVDNERLLIHVDNIDYIAEVLPEVIAKAKEEMKEEAGDGIDLSTDQD